MPEEKIPEARLREACLSTIEFIYPPDSEYASTAAIGREIVAEVVCCRWRELPTALLQEIAQAMTARDHTLSQMSARKSRTP